MDDRAGVGRRMTWLRRWLDIAPPRENAPEDPYRWNALARYNAERGRGLLHSEAWVAFMAREQEEFNRQQAEWYGVVDGSPFKVERG